ncbi:transposase [Candidatus Dependentiae bacterium]|nr:transposase [Candidatus Dependentiae bacterium]
MAIAYSEDLRKRAVGLVKRGRKVVAVAKLLQIGPATLFRWVAKKEKGESLAPKKEWRKGYGNKIPDLNKFKQFAEENQGMTAAAMAEKLGNITSKTVCKWLKRIGFTRKKKVMVTASGMKKIVVYLEKK